MRIVITLVLRRLSLCQKRGPRHVAIVDEVITFALCCNGNVRICLLSVRGWRRRDSLRGRCRRRRNFCCNLRRDAWRCFGVILWRNVRRVFAVCDSAWDGVKPITGSCLMMKGELLLPDGNIVLHPIRVMARGLWTADLKPRANDMERKLVRNPNERMAHFVDGLACRHRERRFREHIRLTSAEDA